MPLNTVFGVLCAIVLVRQHFRGKALLNAAVDLPFAVSPVVIGLALILVYGRNGWFGDWLIDHGIQRDLLRPGMILATIFVSLPFVVREVVPVLRGDRHRAGAGGRDAGRLAVADLLAHHAAGHPLGGGLRRRAHHRPRARRVRRGQHRLGQALRADRDPDRSTWRTASSAST